MKAGRGIFTCLCQAARKENNVGRGYIKIKMRVFGFMGRGGFGLRSLVLVLGFPPRIFVTYIDEVSLHGILVCWVLDSPLTTEN